MMNSHLFLGTALLMWASISPATAEPLPLPPKQYKVAVVEGSFGTYSTLQTGDLLSFDANPLLEAQPDVLPFTSKDEREPPPYLPLHGNFRLEAIQQTAEGKITGYSFLSQHGPKGGMHSSLRIDVKPDHKRMYIIYEFDELVQGVILLEET